MGAGAERLHHHHRHYYRADGRMSPPLPRGHHHHHQRRRFHHRGGDAAAEGDYLDEDYADAALDADVFSLSDLEQAINESYSRDCDDEDCRRSPSPPPSPPLSIRSPPPPRSVSPLPPSRPHMGVSSTTTPMRVMAGSRVPALRSGELYLLPAVDYRVHVLLDMPDAMVVFRAVVPACLTPADIVRSLRLLHRSSPVTGAGARLHEQGMRPGSGRGGADPQWVCKVYMAVGGKDEFEIPWAERLDVMVDRLRATRPTQLRITRRRYNGRHHPR
jgi:hypothetical protein